MIIDHYRNIIWVEEYGVGYITASKDITVRVKFTVQIIGRSIYKFRIHSIALGVAFTHLQSPQVPH